MITDKMTPLMGVLCVQWIEPSLAKYSMMLSSCFNQKAGLNNISVVHKVLNSWSMLCHYGTESIKFIVHMM